MLKSVPVQPPLSDLVILTTMRAGLPTFSVPCHVPAMSCCACPVKG